MIFEEMTKEDLSRVLEMEQACFKEPWNQKDCLYELEENPFSHGWILKKEDAVVGYAFLWETFEIAQLARIGIDPLYRNRGYGQILLENLIVRAKHAECEFMSLEVRESNKPALRLYEKNGFITVNVSQGYYPDGENAVVMTLAL